MLSRELSALTRSIAATHASSNIKAYNVNPMAVMTDMWQKIYDSAPQYAKDAGLMNWQSLRCTTPSTGSG